MMNQRRVMASLQRCGDCGAWWVSQGVEAPQLHLLLRLVERCEAFFPWEKYQGWQKGLQETAACPNCGQPDTSPIFSLYQHCPTGRNPVFH